MFRKYLSGHRSNVQPFKGLQRAFRSFDEELALKINAAVVPLKSEPSIRDKLGQGCFEGFSSDDRAKYLEEDKYEGFD